MARPSRPQLLARLRYASGDLASDRRADALALRPKLRADQTVILPETATLRADRGRSQVYSGLDSSAALYAGCRHGELAAKFPRPSTPPRRWWT